MPYQALSIFVKYCKDRKEQETRAKEQDCNCKSTALNIIVFNAFKL